MLDVEIIIANHYGVGKEGVDGSVWRGNWDVWVVGYYWDFVVSDSFSYVC